MISSSGLWLKFGFFGLRFRGCAALVLLQKWRVGTSGSCGLGVQFLG